MISTISNVLLLAGVTLATPLARRQVNELNQEAFEEAHQRDDTAPRAFSDVQITTSDGKCLSVDELSGDFRANLTPVQVVNCGTTNGEGWDIITSGAHNNRGGQILVVSTLTQACLNFDPRRAAGNQVLLFSCGGRADGGGEVTDSQLFAFDGGAGPLALTPANANGQCLTSGGNALDVAACADGADDQSFTIGGAPSGGGGGNDDDAGDDDDETELPETELPVEDTPIEQTPVGDAPVEETPIEDAPVETPIEDAPAETPIEDAPITTAAPQPPRTRTRTRRPKKSKSKPSRPSKTAAIPDTIPIVTPPSDDEAAATPSAIEVEPSAVTEAPTGAVPSANPTEPVPCSRAGGTLNPSAAAEAHQFDSTATRLIESINIRAEDGRCLFIDPTAGDFRQNLIPVELRECNEDPNQKFDVITEGKHNNGDAGRVLLMNVLMNGCISFDNRRQAGDTVTVFSCGGRAAGEGETDNAQLYPLSQDDIPKTPGAAIPIVLEPLSGREEFCLVAGENRVESVACDGGDSQVFEIVKVL